MRYSFGKKELVLVMVVCLLVVVKLLRRSSISLWYDLILTDTGLFTNSAMIAKIVLLFATGLVGLFSYNSQWRKLWARPLIILIWLLVGLLVVFILLKDWVVVSHSGVMVGATLLQILLYIVYASILHILLIDEFPDNMRVVMSTLLILCIIVALSKPMRSQATYARQMICVGHSGKLIYAEQSMVGASYSSPKMRSEEGERKTIRVQAPGCDMPEGLCHVMLDEVAESTKGCSYLPRYVYTFLKGSK